MMVKKYVFGLQTQTFSCSFSTWFLVDGLGMHTSLKFLTGKGTKYQEIDVVERVRVIGHHTGSSDSTIFLVLTGVENLSVSARKLGLLPIWSWIKMILSSMSFVNFGKVLLWLNSCMVHNQCKSLVWKSSSVKVLLDWSDNHTGVKIFRTKNIEGEMLPPSRASLLPHIKSCKLHGDAG